MLATARTSRWLRAWRMRRAVVTDFGDHGTAFGLDLSLSQLSELKAEPTSATPAPARRKNWVQRLRRRSGSVPA